MCVWLLFSVAAALVVLLCAPSLWNQKTAVAAAQVIPPQTTRGANAGAKLGATRSKTRKPKETFTPTAAASRTRKATRTPTPNPARTRRATRTRTATPTSAPTASPTLTPELTITFDRALAGLGVGAHAVAPDTRVAMQISISATSPLARALVQDWIPRDWQVLDTGGATLTVVDAETQKIEWQLRKLAAGEIFTRTYVLASPAQAPAREYAFQSSVTNAGQRIDSALWTIALEHPLTIPHYRIGRDMSLDRMTYLARKDRPARGVARLKNFRVRFRIVNAQASAVEWQPRVEWSARPDAGFLPLPAGGARADEPFYLHSSRAVTNGQRIRADDFGAGRSKRTPQRGYVFTAQNPAPALMLNAFSVTEIEFNVRASAAAEHGREYYFRLSDDARVIGGRIAQIRMATAAELALTEPQYRGIDAHQTADADAHSDIEQLRARRSGESANPHGAYAADSYQCARCHRSHTGDNRNLLPNTSAQSRLCFGCHDGTDSNKNIRNQYEDEQVPPNDAAASSFYSHAATLSSNHSQARNDEFGGALNRHAECGDCHDAHSSSAPAAAMTAQGWTISGALQDISGVRESASPRALSWRNSIAYEYELCYKCHSGYTTLLSYSRESYQKWDKGAEFDPANASFHPVEGAGTNASSQLANNLAGTSPYKLWNFTTSDVVRCVHCHGGYRLANPASPPLANARLAPHTSKYRGLLTNNYRDRVLKSAVEAYDAADFALCYQCHGEAPYVDSSGDVRDDTNFQYHGYHLTGIADVGSGDVDIDTPGAGQGNALCSECHFRVHGQTTDARGNASGLRLINFAPNVTARSGGQLQWDGAARACSLTCHGKDHDSLGY